jgi:uncharacterized damage-inducible protein DinB
MYTKLQEFLDDWAYESEASQKVLNNLTDDSLKQSVVPGGRTLGSLAWHLGETIWEMMERTGLKVYKPDEAIDKKKAENIREVYKKASDSLIESVTNIWDDSTLLKEDEMYGEKWKRGVTLKALVTHQIHHRAQMTVLMRQAGLRVPGIYGPSKEEWEAMGLKPPAE